MWRYIGLVDIILILIFIDTGIAKYNRVCYFTNWSQYRPGVGRFFPSDIEANLCTHLVYAFGVLTDNEIHTYEWNDKELYKSFNEIKQRNSKVKTLLAIGGWNARSEEFTKMVSSSANRKQFIDQSIKFLRQQNFDGLDLDWEYPALRGGQPSDKVNFGILCQELRVAYEAEALKTGNDRLLITAAVAAGKSNIDPGYDIPVMAKNLDFISLMSYDLHGAWESVTGHNSPLFSKSSDSAIGKQLNIEWAANYWVTLGTPKYKLNIGLATYGRGFTLINTAQYGIGAPARGASVVGNFTREAGFLSYYEICQQQVSGQGQTFRDSEQQVPYYVNSDQWIGFDDEQSLATKVSWLVDQGFAGAMVWALPLDDFNHICSSSTKSFTLIRKIAEELIAAEIGSFSATITTPIPSTTRLSTKIKSSSTSTILPTSTAQTTLPSDFSCNEKIDGNYPFAPDCSKYITCSHGNQNIRKCGPGLLWNPILEICDWSWNVQCIVESTTKSMATTTSSLPTSITTPTITTETTTIVTSGQDSTTSQEGTTLTATKPTTTTTKVFTSSRPTASTKSGITTNHVSTTKTSFTCNGKTGGFYPHPKQCTMFIICVHGLMYENYCPPNQHWNPDLRFCDWDHNVPCDKTTSSTIVTTKNTSTTMKSTTTTPTTVTKPITTTISTTTTASASTTTTTSTTTTPSTITAPSTTTTPSVITTPSATTTPFMTSTPSKTTTVSVSCEGISYGYFLDPNDCSKFVICSHGISYRRSCADGLLWNVNKEYCDWPKNVNCTSNSPEV